MAEKIKREDIKGYVVELESDYIHFLINKTVEQEGIGDNYWQGIGDYGAEFTIPVWALDELRDEMADGEKEDEESVADYLTEDCFELVEEILDNVYQF